MLSPSTIMAINLKETFGANVRRLREEKKVSLRAFARTLRMSATYLSKIERGEFHPPSEKKVKAIARALAENEDEMLALAGRVSGDLTKIILTNPLPLATFLRAVEGMRAEDVQRYARAAQRARVRSKTTKR